MESQRGEENDVAVGTEQIRVRACTRVERPLPTTRTTSRAADRLREDAARFEGRR